MLMSAKIYQEGHYSAVMTFTALSAQVFSPSDRKTLYDKKISYYSLAHIVLGLAGAHGFVLLFYLI